MKQVTNDNYLKKPIEEEDNKEFDFCMCNPPFFKNEFEASHGVTRSTKRPQPSGALEQKLKLLLEGVRWNLLKKLSKTASL